MTRRSCDGVGLLAAFRAAVANLEAHVEEINELNVFPVPDGDTGSNMAATVRVALEEAEGAAGQPADRIAAAISFGALMGARGNSGVITSQILNGMARGLAHKRRFNGLDLAHCLALGTETAYAAVKKPVEGTILTVIREASAAAKIAAERDDSIETVLAATVDAAEKAVAKTPSLLPILREAGVVDSGGQGLYRLFQGALKFVVGEAAAGAVSGRTLDAARPSVLVAHADEGFGYEVMFLLQPPAGQDLDLDAIRTHLETIGESVVVAGDARAIKVHVHNDRPDGVIGYGLGLGSLSRISVENLDHQARDVREDRASAFTGAAVRIGLSSGEMTPGAAAGATDGSDPRAATDADGASRSGTVSATSQTTFAPGALDGTRVKLAVVAVAAGEGLATIFADFGVAAVVRGGQAANPSTGELLAAVDALNADEVLLLPNNPNVVLAARQVADLARRPVHVVPTRNAAEGFAALLALDPGESGADNVADMTERGRGLATLQVTTAVRDAKIGGRKVRKGQTIVLDPDDGLVSADADPDNAILSAVRTLPPETELVTLFYGEEAVLAEAEGVAGRIAAARPGAEVEVRHGGQPHYRYLISAE
jgi:DAK2 domain fusion protein YloV